MTIMTILSTISLLLLIGMQSSKRSVVVHAWDCTFQVENEIQLQDNLILRNVFHPVEKVVKVQLEYNGIGWLAFAFSNGEMMGSHAVVGLPENDIVQRYYMSSKDEAGVTVEMNETLRDALTETSIVQTDTTTILTFTQPMEEDGIEYKISHTEPNSYIYAYGWSNKPIGYHANRGTTNAPDLLPMLTLTSCVPEEGDVMPDSNIFNSTTDDEDDVMDLGEDDEPGNGLQCAFGPDIILNENLILREYYNRTDKTVTIQLEYNGEGWLGFGFSTDGLMPDTYAVIGLPDENIVQRYYMAERIFGGVQPTTDGTALTDATIVQDGDGMTVLTFTHPLMEDGIQPAVLADGTNTFIWATGEGNTLGYHGGGAGNRDLGTLTLTPCGSPPEVDDETSSPTPAPIAAEAGNDETVPNEDDDGDGSYSGTFQIDDLTTLSFLADASTKILSVEMLHEGQAWLGAGLTDDGIMVGSTVVIGLPDTGIAEKYALTARSTAGVNALPTDGQTLIDSSIVQNETHTVLTYMRSFVDGADELEVPTSDSIRFIWAYGSSNALGFHRARGDFMLSVEAGSGDGVAVDDDDDEDAAVPESNVTSSPADDDSIGDVQLQCSFGVDMIINDNLILREFYNPQDETVTIQMEYKGEGWLGFGFSTNGLMPDTYAVIGLPDENVVQRYFMTARSLDGVQPTTDDLGQDTLMNATIEQNGDGRTVLTFTHPLVEDGIQPAVSADGTNTFIWATGDSNVLGYHGFGPENRDSGTLTLSRCGSPPKVDESLQCDFGADLAINDNLVLREYYHPTDETVTIQLEYDGEGWIGFGFNTDGLMPDTYAVIGLPEENIVQRYFMTARSMDGVQPTTDNLGQDTLTNATIVQNGDGRTVLTFTHPVVEDGIQPAVSAAGTNTFIWATGDSNVLGYHGFGPENRDSGTLRLSPCGNPPEVVEVEAPIPTPSPTAPQAGGGAVVADDGSYAGTQVIDDLTTLSFMADVSTGLLNVEMVHEGQAWLGAGLTDDGMMVGSTVVIGLPDDEIAEKYALTSRSTAGVNSLPEDDQTLIDASIMQNDTHTVLSYTRSFVDSSDELEVPTSGNIRFIWAYGSSNALSAHPTTTRGNFLFDIESGVSESSAIVDTERKWNAHGLMMALAWGIFVPIAIGSSLLRHILPLPPGVWFKIHFYSNTSAIILTIVGFSLAVNSINEEAGDNGFRHFSDKRHHVFGLIVFILSIVQAASGYARPHAPHPPQSNDDDDNKDQPAPAAQSHKDDDDSVEVASNPPPHSNNDDNDKGGEETSLSNDEDGKGDQAAQPPAYNPDYNDNDNIPGAGSGEVISNAPKSNDDGGGDDAKNSLGGHGEKKSILRFLWEIQHRLLGLLTLIFALWNCSSGMEEYEIRFGNDFSTAFWAVVGSLMGIIVVAYAVQTLIRQRAKNN